MPRRFPSAQPEWRYTALLRVLVAALAAWLIAPTLRAQDIPGAIGRILGDDVSVEGGPGTVSLDGIVLASGSVVTVRSGRAQVSLATGGQLSVCGPAKFTVLQSGSELTIALNFGRIRAEVMGAEAATFYTPDYTANAIPVEGGMQDVTLGLDLSGALCVLARRGALRLIQQFTSEGIIIPQGGEFFFQRGNLLPIPGQRGSCECASFVTRPSPKMPADVAGPPEASANSRKPAAPSPASFASRMRESVEFAAPAHPEATSSAERNSPGVPAAQQPVWKVLMPPLSFNAAGPAPPPSPSPETILLVREARVEPDWVFRGRVEEEKRSEAVGTSATARRTAKLAKKKNEGFWARLRAFFFGRAAEPRRCSGPGCAGGE